MNFIDGVPGKGIPPVQALLFIDVPQARNDGTTGMRLLRDLRGVDFGCFNFHSLLCTVFTRQEASRIREEFWTTFGRYMNPIHSAEGMQINWVNYHTRLKDVYFRMDAGPKNAMICISLEHRDPGVQELFFDQFRQLKTMLELQVGEEWEWHLHAQVNDKTLSRICKVLPNVSVLNREHWPELISFFKPRIIALDSFWEDARYSFDDLR